VEATPVCLPKLGEHSSWVGKIPKVAGWGMPDEKAGSTTRLLQKLDVPIIEAEECQDMMEMDLPERMLCAGYKQGDKGLSIYIHNLGNFWST
jgi:hypothetical protein